MQKSDQSVRFLFVDVCGKPRFAAWLREVASNGNGMIAIEYMESGDKEEILEAMGIFAEDVDWRFELIEQRFDGVDQRFDSIDTRFENGDRRFGSIEQRLDRIESTMATKDDIVNIMDSLDWLVSHAKKFDQELVMLAHGFSRLSDDVDKIKPLVGLA